MNLTSLLPLEGCDDCTLKKEWRYLSSPCMPVNPPKVASNVRILVVGEAPGASEDRDGIPFVGETGKLLRNTMPKGWAEKVYWTNTVRCRPPDNRAPALAELTCCSNYMEEDLDRINPHAILAVGGAALQYFWQGASVMSARGVEFPIQLPNGAWIRGYSTFHPSYVARGNKANGDNTITPVFEGDLARFFTNTERYLEPLTLPVPPSRKKVLFPRSFEEVKALFRRLKPRPGMDFETFRLKPYLRDARMLTAAFSDGVTTFAFPVSWYGMQGEWGTEAVVWCLEQLDFWVAHNASFELVWAWYMCTKFDHRFDDTAARARLIHQRSSLTSLADQTRINLGVDIKTLSDLEVTRLTAYPLEDVLYYNALDAWSCYQLNQIQKVDAANQINYERLQESIRSTTAMELFGLPVDLDVTADLKVGLSEKAEAYQQEARALPEVQSFCRKYNRPFSLSQPESVGRVLTEFCGLNLPKTSEEEGAQYGTGKEILQEFAGVHPLVELVSDWREVDKLRGTYVEKILMGENLGVDGLLHPSYTTYLTATGRLSSTDPNIQNFPKRKHREVRKQVVPPPGCVMASCDYGQLEARGICIASGDRRLLQNFVNHEDIHQRWLLRTLELYPQYLDRLAEKTGQSEEKKIRKAGRDIIKTDLVFSSFYGSKVPTVSRYTMIPLDITEQIMSEFWTEYDGVKDWVDGQFRFYQTHGYIETLTKMVRNEVLPGNEVINNVIQGTGAHIVLEAQNALYRLAMETGDLYLMPRINIHDDLTFFLPDDERLEGYIRFLTSEMVKPRFSFVTCPLMVECKIGPNWSDFEEVCKIEGSYWSNGVLVSMAA